MATPDPPIEEQDEPITGWRIWNLSQDGDGPRLRPAGSGVDAWKPRQAMEARCGLPALLTRSIGQHNAPDIRCRCGIYAGRSLDTFPRPRPAWPPPPVVGTVALWGTVIEHERGWRARYAYPSRLRLVCSMCAWFEPGPGEPSVVHTFFNQLYTLCEEHRGGIELPDGRRTQPTGIAPRALQSSLLDAYAVDLVPAEALASLFRLPPTPTPAAYLPSIHTVPVEEEGMPRSNRMLPRWLRTILDGPTAAGS